MTAPMRSSARGGTGSSRTQGSPSQNRGSSALVDVKGKSIVGASQALARLGAFRRVDDKLSNV
jgi:hypothetical protein